MEQVQVSVGWIFGYLFVFGILGVVVAFGATPYLKRIVNSEPGSTGEIMAELSPPYLGVLVGLSGVSLAIREMHLGVGWNILVNMILVTTAVYAVIRMMRKVREGVSEQRFGKKAAPKGYPRR